MGGNSPEMDVAAARVLATVLGVAAPHTKTGAYNSRLRVKKVAGRNGVSDRAVTTTDPQALAIEYGHWWITPEGKKVRWIKGIRIFNRAYSLMRE